MRTKTRPAARAEFPPTLRAILELAPTPLIVLNPKGEVALWNPSAETLFGWKESEVLGKRLPLIQEADWADFDRRLKDELKGRTDRTLREYRAKDGRLVQVALSTSPLTGEEGKTIGVIGAMIDLSEELRAKDELHRSDEELRWVTDHMPDAISALLRDGKIAYESPSIERVLGYDPKERIGKLGLDFVHPEDRWRVFRAFRRVMEKSGSQCIIEYRARKKDGSWIDVESVGKFFREAEGGGRLVLNSRDVTERRKAEDERLRLSAALEQSPVVVIMTDRDGTINYVNARFCQLYGYAAEEVLGKNPRILKSGHTSPEEYARLWATLKSGKSWRGELQNKKKSGEVCSVAATISPIRNAAGQITHFVGMQEDVTGRKQLEAQFLQAQKMEIVGRLAGGVAHDFNNLLTVILGNTEILLADLSPDDPRRKDLEETRDTARRAADLTRQLLTFSRRQTAEPRPLSVNGIVHGVEKMLRRLIGEDLVLRIDAKSAHDTVKADPGQLEQVLVNLAVNARDAMPSGGSLTISTEDARLDAEFARSHPGAFEGPAVVLSVRDNGSGMTEEVKVHLFEPFFTTKEVGKGTGLGLATCYGIVRQSGGFIEVNSSPGRGTEFRVCLPRA